MEMSRSALLGTGRGRVLCLRVPSAEGDIAVWVEAPSQITIQHLKCVQRYLELAEEDAGPETTKPLPSGNPEAADGGNVVTVNPLQYTPLSVTVSEQGGDSAVDAGSVTGTP